MSSTLPDIQGQRIKARSIDKVGVRCIKAPIQVWETSSVGKFSLYCDLKDTSRGVHMSRFTEQLFNYSDLPTNDPSQKVLSLASQIKDVVDAEVAYVKVTFPYFVEKRAPVSNKVGLMDYEVELMGIQGTDETRLLLRVKVPYTSLCPCSKEISEGGAHNQRSTADITVRVSEEGLADVKALMTRLIFAVEFEASCELYSVLKRADEKYVTEAAYKHPRFVEDMARALEQTVSENYLKQNQIIGAVIVVNHHESIHNHDAVAVMRVGEYLP